MIDPISTGVSVKTLVDLFKTGLGLIDRAKKDKQKKFNDVYKPLYLELEKIANRYHKIIQEAVHRLSKDKPDFDTIIREIKEGRDQLVFIRYAVIGKSRSLLGRVLINRDWSAARVDRCPLYPRKRTCAVQLGMSALGQKRTFARIKSMSAPHTIGLA
jgi:hypothetical protein